MHASCSVDTIEKERVTTFTRQTVAAGPMRINRLHGACMNAGKLAVASYQHLESVQLPPDIADLHPEDGFLSAVNRGHDHITPQARHLSAIHALPSFSSSFWPVSWTYTPCPTILCANILLTLLCPLTVPQSVLPACTFMQALGLHPDDGGRTQGAAELGDLPTCITCQQVRCYA